MCILWQDIAADIPERERAGLVREKIQLSGVYGSAGTGYKVQTRRGVGREWVCSGYVEE